MLFKAVWTNVVQPVAAVDFTGRPKPWEPRSLGMRVDPVDKGNYWYIRVRLVIAAEWPAKGVS